MKTKHTPGPWTSFTDGSKAWVKSASNQHVAQMSADVDRCDADARIIAAAPTMLDLLGRLNQIIHDLEGAGHFEYAVIEELDDLTRALGVPYDPSKYK